MIAFFDLSWVSKRNQKVIRIFLSTPTIFPYMCTSACVCMKNLWNPMRISYCQRPNKNLPIQHSCGNKQKFEIPFSIFIVISRAVRLTQRNWKKKEQQNLHKFAFVISIYKFLRWPHRTMRRTICNKPVRCFVSACVWPVDFSTLQTSIILLFAQKKIYLYIEKKWKEKKESIRFSQKSYFSPFWTFTAKRKRDNNGSNYFCCVFILFFRFISPANHIQCIYFILIKFRFFSLLLAPNVRTL